MKYLSLQNIYRVDLQNIYRIVLRNIYRKNSIIFIIQELHNIYYMEL